MMFIKATCAHIFSLSIGVLIIVGITLLAKSLRDSTHKPHVVQCYNCNYNAHFPISCISKEAYNETTCHGVCVRSILEGTSTRSKIFSQFCFNSTDSILTTPECPAGYRLNATAKGLDVKICKTCSTNFCNSFEDDK